MAKKRYTKENRHERKGKRIPKSKSNYKKKHFKVEGRGKYPNSTNVFHDPKSHLGDAARIGCVIDREKYSYLTLYSIVKNESKSSIVRKLLEEWIELKIEDGYTIEDLIKDAVYMIEVKWKKKKQKNRHASFPAFLDHIKNELIIRYVPEDWIDIIINNVKK